MNSSALKGLFLMIDEEHEEDIRLIKEKIFVKCQQNFKNKREAFRYFDLFKNGCIAKNDFTNQLLDLNIDLDND